LVSTAKTDVANSSSIHGLRAPTSSIPSVSRIAAA
jgi:hypothetical protein